jgi:hypothetical protein
VAALTGAPEVATDDAPAPGPRAGFDGGARMSVPGPRPDHNQWLVAILESRRADVGGRGHFRL